MAQVFENMEKIFSSNNFIIMLMNKYESNSKKKLALVRFWHQVREKSFYLEERQGSCQTRMLKLAVLESQQANTFIQHSPSNTQKTGVKIKEKRNAYKPNIQIYQIKWFS